MKNVYVISKGHISYNQDILGIFQTSKEAFAAAKKYAKENRWYKIRECEVIGDSLNIIECKSTNIRLVKSFDVIFHIKGDFLWKNQ